MQTPASAVDPIPQPTEPLVVIFNSRALAARALRRAGLEEALRDRNIRYELHDTGSADGSQARAEQAARAGRIVVAAGGDGTMKDVLNGVLAAERRDAVLGHIPLGTGNDIARALGRIADGFEKALDALQQMRLQEVDVGQVEDGEYFVNALGVGFDAEVARRAARLRIASYFPAVVGTIVAYRPQEYRVSWPDGDRHGHGLMVTAMNGSYEGGGFRLAPGASLQDGLLDVYWIDPISIWDFTRYVWAVRWGTHERLSVVHKWRTKRMTVESEGRLQYHVDGEYRERPAGSRLEIRLHPRRLRVIT